MHCGCKNNVGPAVSFSSCDSLSRILVKGRRRGSIFFFLPLNWKVVLESVLGENVEETKFKWRRRRVSDNVSFFKNWWRHFYGDKNCLICWIMRHIFDKLLKDEWMSTLDSTQDVKEFAENLKFFSAYWVSMFILNGWMAICVLLLMGWLIPTGILRFWFPASFSWFQLIFVILADLGWRADLDLICDWFWLISANLFCCSWFQLVSCDFGCIQLIIGLIWISYFKTRLVIFLFISV